MTPWWYYNWTLGSVKNHQPRTGIRMDVCKSGDLGICCSLAEGRRSVCCTGPLVYVCASCTYIHTHIYIYLCICVFMFVFIYVFICVHVYIFIERDANTQTYLHIQMYMNIFVKFVVISRIARDNGRTCVVALAVILSCQPASPCHEFELGLPDLPDSKQCPEPNS